MEGERERARKNQITWPSIIINSWWNGHTRDLNSLLLSSMHSASIVDRRLVFYANFLVLFFHPPLHLILFSSNKLTFWKIKCCSCYLCYWAIYRHLFYFISSCACFCVPFIVNVLFLFLFFLFFFCESYLCTVEVS